MKAEELIERLETIPHVTTDKSDNHNIRLIYKPTQAADYPRTLLIFPIDAKDVFDFVIHPATIRQYLTSNHRDYLWLELSQYLKTPISERKAKTKYTVQVFLCSMFGFLNVSRYDSAASLSDNCDGKMWQTEFTQDELEQLKQRGDVAIDWDKAIIKPVEGD